MQSYDVAALRSQFPALASGTAHFDGPGGSQVPLPVARAVAETLTSGISNRGRLTASERRADGIVVGARAALGDLLGADPEGVIFGRSMTQLTYDVARAMAKDWHPGDEVVVTRLDHDADVQPWIQAAEAVGAVVRWADFDPASTELTADHIAEVLSPRTRLVAVTAASNLVGTRPPIAQIAARVHETGALLFVDGVHLTPHAPVDVVELGADLYTCSPYKWLGPHCGVLAAAPELLATLHPDKLAASSDAVPGRFELGTLPYELLAGCTAAVDFIAALASPWPETAWTPDPDGALAATSGSTSSSTPGPPFESTSGRGRRDDVLAAMRAIEAHEHVLDQRLTAGLVSMPELVVHSRAAVRTPTLLITVPGTPAVEVQEFLAARNINAPAGSFYAPEPSRRLGLGETGGLRIGLAPYTDDNDIDRLLTGLTDFLKTR